MPLLVWHLAAGAALGTLLGFLMWFLERQRLRAGWAPLVTAGIGAGLIAGLSTGVSAPSQALSVLPMTAVVAAVVSVTLVLSLAWEASPDIPQGSAVEVVSRDGTATAPEAHPQALAALLVGLLGLFAFPVISPVAWYLGAKALREMDAAPGQHGGRSQAYAGQILGILGTVLLVVGGIALLALVLIVNNAITG